MSLVRGTRAREVVHRAKLKPDDLGRKKRLHDRAPVRRYMLAKRGVSKDREYPSSDRRRLAAHDGAEPVLLEHARELHVSSDDGRYPRGDSFKDRHSEVLAVRRNNESIGPPETT